MTSRSHTHLLLSPLPTPLPPPSLSSPPLLPPPPPPSTKWCSGGGDYAPGDVFGAGVDGICPILPPAWDDEKKVQACERVCAANASCLGFTYYPATTSVTSTGERDVNYINMPNTTECCFRTGSVANKPLDANSTARCYEKVAPPLCNGAPTGVMIPGE
jgi:hypothetical protein